MANAICERVIGTIRRECLDWLIPVSELHLRSMLKEWVTHYNGARARTWHWVRVFLIRHQQPCDDRLTYPGIGSAGAWCCASNRYWVACITNIRSRPHWLTELLRITGQARSSGLPDPEIT